MNPALARLEQRHEALIEALDSNELAAIEAASGELHEALEQVRTVDAWQREPEIKLMAERIGRLAEAARMRVNLLSDLARRRQEAMAAARGTAPAAVYGR